ncbi:APC amino acid permease [Fomes fomentarius]|nr:APC amino acid permease [Fomes fomentarius]
MSGRHPGEATSRTAEEEPLLIWDEAQCDVTNSYATVEVQAVALVDNNDSREFCLTSTISLISNRVIGTGIFSAPSVILRSSGSVGVSLVLWLLGAAAALCGTAVYIEFGTGLPRNGGEKNYLEYLYRQPKLLATCIYAVYAVFIGWQAAACSAFGEFVFHAFDPTSTPSASATRVAGVACMTFAFLLHGVVPKAGLRVQNALGMFKLLVLFGITLSGLASMFRVPGFRSDNPPKNFEWNIMWEGSLKGGANAFVTGLCSVIWCFSGYSNANYALAEVGDPVRTLKRAAPLAMISVTVVYMLVNIAYYVVVDKGEILGGGRIVAALYFGKLWGVNAERIVSAIIALSILGNIMSALFTHGRVIQVLGREGVLPFSSFFAGNRPFNTPLGGLFEQWFISSSIVLLVTPGDTYLFMLNLTSYPLALTNMFVSGGLLFLHTPERLLPKRLRTLRASYDWLPPFQAWTWVVVLFLLSNVLLVAVPLIPPARGFNVYDTLPYWLHVLVAWLMSCAGLTYWYVWCVWLPRRGGYVLVPDWVRDNDGLTRRVVRKAKASSCLVDR